MTQQTRPYKILVAGPVGAGKTTLIRSLSETPLVETEAHATEEIGKATTTVALDFGTLRSDDGREVFLFGLPGQDRFDFMWEVLSTGALGSLLLLRADQPAHVTLARRFLEFLRSQVPGPVVVAPTHLDRPEHWSLEEIADFLRFPLEQMVGIDPRSRERAAPALFRLLELLAS